MKRSRVMHVVVGGDIGGAERLLVDLATRPLLTRADHEVAVFTPNRSLAQYFTGAGLRVHDRGFARESPVAYLRRSLGWSDVRWLSALLAERGIDVVHTHTFGSHVLGTRAATRVDRPQLRTEHHFVHYFDPSCRLFTRWAAERTDAIVAVSDFVRHTIVLAMPILGFRTTVARNGVDTAYWSPRDKAALGFRAGIVCRLTAWKRVHLAIRASAIAGVDLVVVGSGEERGRLESLAQSLDAPVRFVGYEPDPRPLIAECDVMLNTSDREPLGLSVMEALAMGRPVIACSGGGIPEILKDGDTGLLVREASAEAFAHALRSVRDDPGRRATMGMRAREYAVAEGSIERTCEVYAREYDRLSRDPRSGALR